MNQLEKFLKIEDEEVTKWFDSQYSKYSKLVYSSVDIRDNGKKIVPVDTNLFPAGFNNIHHDELDNCASHFRDFVVSLRNPIKHIFVLSENHTRNKNYFQNLYVIKKIILAAGYEVAFISDHLEESMDLNILFGIDLIIHPFTIQNSSVYVKNLEADLIISNNDFSDGIKTFQDKDIKQQIIPDINLGWFKRKKSKNLQMYSEVIEEFCNDFGLDKFFFSAEYENCGEINFKEKKGIDCVANKVDKLIHKLSNCYNKYEINQDPYVFVKAERGTYGMGVMAVQKGSEVFEMNKKLRNKMDIIKGGVKNSEVIIQEGIATDIKYKDMPAEMMVYLINGEPVSFITRYHEAKNRFGSLNSPGLQFSNNKNFIPKPKQKIYSVIAKLASLAASREIGCS